MIRPLLILLAILLVAQAGGVAVQVHHARDAALATARGLSDRVSLSVTAAVNRTLVQVDAGLLGLPLLLQPLAAQNSLSVDAANELLRQINSHNFTHRDLLIVLPDGRSIAAAQPGSRRRLLSPPLGPLYVPVGYGHEGLSIAGPVLNPMTGEPSLFLARAVTVPGLGPAHAVAEVPLSAIDSLLTSGGDLPGLRVMLTRGDGTLLGSAPAEAMTPGQRVAPASGSGRALVSRLDGHPVIATTRATLYPGITVTAELDEHAALANWREDRNAAIVLAGAFSIMLVALGGIMLFWLTQREGRERERQRWRQTLETAINSMTEGFVMFDRHDRLIICNESYRRMYSISAPFIREGASFDDIIRQGALRGQYPQLQGDIEEFLQDIRRQRATGVADIERLLPDGTWVLITERRMPGGGTVGIRTNITTLKRAMEEASAARDAAQQASAARGMFLARMSHELRTPLNAVLGFAQILMLDKQLDARGQDHLRHMSEAAAHLRDVVNTLLDLSKAEAGKLEITPRPTPLRPLVESATGLLSVEAERRALAITLEMDEALPATVMADAMRLRQVLLNLLSNAVKFSTPGTRIILRVRATPGAGVLRFEVEDGGPGIPAHRRGQLFRDFSQIKLLPEAELSGTGLGLAISAQITAAMGGRIGVTDGQAKGALFWVELPLAKAGPPGPAPGEAAPPQQGLRLLVVDDIAVNRLLARVMLEQAGHIVDLANNGEEALAAVQCGGYDAVLMDVQMPLMDGLEATRRIRQLAGAAGRTPVIALSASAMTDQVEACRAAGMDAHLAKPIDRLELLATVQEIREWRVRAGVPLGAPLAPGPAGAHDAANHWEMPPCLPTPSRSPPCPETASEPR